MPETLPPPEPMVVRMAVLRMVRTEDGRDVLQVIGSTVVPPASMNGMYVGPDGYTSDISTASDIRGEAGKTIVQGQTTEVVGPQGPAGQDGKSALTIWREQGNSGDAAVFLASLKGDQGPQGTQGLKGDKGDPGEQGPAGQTGPQGAEGPKGNTGATGPQGTAGPTGATGPKGDTGPQGATGATGAQGIKGDTGAKGDTGSQGPKGDTGPAGATLVGQVVVGQSAVVAIALGIREITVPLTGAVVGERYMAFARSYKLNNGASVNGRPPGYTILDCACNTAGQITVSLNAPLLAIGASYAITTDIVKVNAS